jgi:hypothetical protein
MLPDLDVALIGQLRFAQLFDHGAEEPIGDREIEDGVALSAMGLCGLVKSTAKLLVQLGRRQIGLDIRRSRRKPLPHGLVYVVDIELRGGVAYKAFQHVVEVATPALRGFLRPAHADQREFLQQHLGARKVVECRHHQTLGQVTGGTEKHHGARIGRTGLAPRRGDATACAAGAGRIGRLSGGIGIPYSDTALVRGASAPTIECFSPIHRDALSNSTSARRPSRSR